ncbi:MAG: NTP transferase domain-containing protein [Acidobacteriota bacterium]|nr:NTP transferase domain-containing protein [Acidobacteriota bacterium]
MARPGGDAPALVMLAAGMAKRYGGPKPLAPVGLHGEALVDVAASDAMAAGFGEIVVVLGPHSGPAIAYHLARSWPPSVPVSVAEQTVPLGTAHAALCARRAVGDRPFALVNADDVYGTAALAELCAHLRAGEDHANVLYRLEHTVLTDDPVTRAACTVTPDGWLAAMVERKHVHRDGDGGFVADDGKEPAALAPDTLVSVNLWGIQPALWPVLVAAVTAVHPAVGPDGTVTGDLAGDEEVLLPEVVGAMVEGRAPDGSAPQRVRALRTDGRCIGVTHAEDLAVARTELALMVGTGERAERLWSGPG